MKRRGRRRGERREKVCELLTLGAFYLRGVSGFKVMCALKDMHAQARVHTLPLSLWHNESQSALELLYAIIVHY